MVFSNSILPKVRGVFVVFSRKSQVNQGFKSFLDLGKLSIIKNNPGVMQEIRKAFSLASETLKANQNFIHLGIENFDLSYIENNVDPILETCDLHYFDAFHYSFAKSQDITNIVSADADYSVINDPNLNIYMDTGTFLKILLRNNISVPHDLLEYYINKCQGFGFPIPEIINRYYQKIITLISKRGFK